MHKFAIVYRHRGADRQQAGKTFAVLKKAEAEAKRMNDAVRIKGNGKYVVIEL
jgi:hypothetical protein